MGKNNRHKKRLKSEKSKTQLKSTTKFLPKGQNVTKTDFKIKPIVIVPQLQGKTDLEHGRKEIDLKDVLSRTRHYNENMKIKACEELEHLIKFDKTKLSGGNVPLVIQHLSEFIQLKMPKARKAGLVTITTFLKNFSSHQIAPYFHYFSVNLRCAMTHIDRNIQEDSINFFDSFLINVPQLIREHSSQIFPDFLTLISKFKNNEFGRTISLNLSSKFTSLNWRIMVFSRLYTFLEAIMSENISKEMVKNEFENLSFNIDSDRNFGLYKQWDALMKPKNYVFTDFSSNFKEDRVEVNFLQLIPLLHETWLECCPKNDEKGVTHITDQSTAILLNCIVKVYNLLWSYLNKKQNESLKNEEILSQCEKLMKSLTKSFPYNLTNRPNLEKSNRNKFLNCFITNDVKCTEENLMISYLYLVLCSEFKQKKNVEIDNIFEYISSTLLRNYKDSNIDITYLFIILNFLLIDKVQTRNRVHLQRILENSILLHENGNLNMSTRNVLFKLLGKIENPILIENPSYQNWLENCSKLLLEPNINGDVINAMFDMSRKNKTAFVRGYVKRFSSILANLPDLNVTNTRNEEKIKLRILDILLYIPSLKSLSKILNNSNTNCKYSKHIEYVIKSRNEFNSS